MRFGGRVLAILLLVAGALTLARGVLGALSALVPLPPRIHALLPAGLLIALGGAAAGLGWVLAGLVSRHEARSPQRPDDSV